MRAAKPSNMQTTKSLRYSYSSPLWGQRKRGTTTSLLLTLAPFVVTAIFLMDFLCIHATASSRTLSEAKKDVVAQIVVVRIYSTMLTIHDGY